MTVDDSNISRGHDSSRSMRRWSGSTASQAPETPLNEREQTIAYQILKEIRARLTSWSTSASTT